jgi:hypothetical protein
MKIDPSSPTKKTPDSDTTCEAVENIDGGQDRHHQEGHEDAGKEPALGSEVRMSQAH